MEIVLAEVLEVVAVGVFMLRLRLRLLHHGDQRILVSDSCSGDFWQIQCRGLHNITISNLLSII